MRRIVFITGGQRSGKSNYAKGLAEQLSANPLYLATARYWDEDFAERIRKHQQDRSDIWQTIEEERHIDKLQLEGKVVLLDCITLWLTNIYNDNDYKVDPSLTEAKCIWDKFIDQDFTLIVVSNEIGMGTHAYDESSRHFADMQGWMNQHIAKSADEVFFCVSGIPIKIK